jgi:thiosulfate reductase cytochrome b subunit
MLIEADANPVISSKLWVYFVIMVPLTVIILLLWTWYDRRKEEKYARDDADLEKDIDKMEKDIMFHLRKRTMSKANTWNTISPPPKP